MARVLRMDSRRTLPRYSAQKVLMFSVLTNYSWLMAKKVNTDICVDIKTRLICDCVALVEKNYAGVLRRDSQYHFTFTETNRPSKGKKTPQVFNGKLITVTCSSDGHLRLNLKATYLNEDFAVEDFAKGIAQEINQALDGLIEKE